MKSGKACIIFIELTWITIRILLIHGTVVTASSSMTDSLASMLSSSLTSYLSRGLKSGLDESDSTYPHQENDNIGSFRQLSLASTQSFIQRRLFNTSVALTVPIFSFTLPQRASQGSTVDLANQVIKIN